MINTFAHGAAGHQGTTRLLGPPSLRETARTAEGRGQPKGADSRRARTAERRGQPNGADSRTARNAEQREAAEQRDIKRRER